MPPRAAQLFLRARRWQQGLPSSEPCCWRLYADAALLEWRRGRDAGVARNIFEKGLEDARVAREPGYVLAYLDLLTGKGGRAVGAKTKPGLQLRPGRRRPGGVRVADV
jgi:hypothetical protein